MQEAVAQIKEKSEVHYLLAIENLDANGVAITDPDNSESEPKTVRFTFDDGEQLYLPSHLLLDLALAGVSPHVLPKSMMN